MKIDPPARPDSGRRLRLSREERISDIMDAAQAVFCAKGYAAAGVAEIAAQLGIVEGTIYRYFPTKRDLLSAVAADWYARIFADYDEQLKGIEGTRNRLRFMVWRHLKVIHDEPAMCRLVMGEVRGGEEYRASAVFELNREYTRRTLGIVKDAMEAGEFRADAPLALVRDMIYGAAEHHTWAYLRGEGDFSPDQAADEIVGIVYRGLATADGRDSRLENITRRLERVARAAESRRL